MPLGQAVTIDVFVEGQLALIALVNSGRGGSRVPVRGALMQTVDVRRRGLARTIQHTAACFLLIKARFCWA